MSNGEKFDYIIIDEVSEFTPDMWDKLKTASNKMDKKKEPQPAVVATNEAKIFYQMVAMFKCALDNADYLINTPKTSVSTYVKQELKLASHRFKSMMLNFSMRLKEEDRQAWAAEWERDYQSAASIFNYWGAMTEEQRAALEEFAKQLSEGNVKIEYDTTGTNRID